MNTNAKTFTRDDLKAGHVVKLRNGEFRMLMPAGKDGTLIVCGAPENGWNYLSCWDENFCARSQRFALGYPSSNAEEYASALDIMEVYGFVRGSAFYNKTGELSADNRDLLWQRIKPKKMTVKEICEKLGYPVEIIPEE